MSDTPFQKERDIQALLIALKHDTCDTFEKCQACKGLRLESIAAIERLHNELYVMKGSYDVVNESAGQWMDKYFMAQSDAERYRYLRSQPPSCEPNRIDVVYWTLADESANEGEGLRGDALDAAIDAQLRLMNPTKEPP